MNSTWFQRRIVSILLWLIISTIFYTIMREARAHEAPAGWSYDQKCCSNQDCREIPDDWIEETPRGYRIRITDETIPYSDARIKDSLDGHFHLCQLASTVITTKAICLYVPPRGF